MQQNRDPPPYPEKLTIALLGKTNPLKDAIGNKILSAEDYFNSASNDLVVGENNSFIVIKTHDFFDEKCKHPDQQIIDFMAISYPGPNLFMLVMDPGNTQEEKVVAQISKLQDIFGENITTHLVVMLPDVQSSQSLSHLREIFHVQLGSADDNLVHECRRWSPIRNSFLFNYKNYTQEAVTRRRAALEKRRYNPPSEDATAGTRLYVTPDNIFNIVLLGQTGTGKSASGNSILSLGSSKSRPRPFVSRPSSIPVTKVCDARFMSQGFGMPVRVVDTPDFFHDELRNPEAQVAECRKYCQRGECVVLLVLQLGRVTDGERGILEKLEDMLGWKLREETIVVLTHADDLRESLVDHVNSNPALRDIVDKCSFRCKVLNNNSKGTKQVVDLIRSIPNYEKRFPKLAKKESSECLLC
ncbi:GTPase IMAP family member 8 [Scophthalmus maximus]|uniref:GTPase IMAP family member 8 n=1 Tax=Scophthalmus maximus TaxID=52904 RepID=UPI001FA90F2A|nr:GTPase IMAP family member 8 [Scophthalmus maximus]